MALGDDDANKEGITCFSKYLSQKICRLNLIHIFQDLISMHLFYYSTSKRFKFSTIFINHNVMNTNFLKKKLLSLFNVEIRSFRVIGADQINFKFSFSVSV